MNRGHFRVGNNAAPPEVRREVSGMFYYSTDRDGPTPEVELKPPHRCGSRFAILVRVGELYCRRCGLAV